MSNCPSVETCSTKVEEIGYIYVFTPVCAIGIVFNCLNLYVFSKSQFNTKMTSSILTYLTALALADLMSCITALPLAFIRCVDATTVDIQYFYNVYEKYIYYPFFSTFLTTGVWITLILTMDRFIFVTKINGEVSGQSSIRSTKGTMCISICTVAIAMCIFIPTFFFYDDITGDKELIESEFGESLGYEIYSWIRIFVTTVMPILVVTALNIALVRVTWISSKRCKVHVFPAALYTKRIKVQRKMTAMLLSISFTFVFCHSLEPLLNSRVYDTLFGPCSIGTSEFAQFRVIVLTLEMVSCASNFISYCIFNSHFILTLKNCNHSSFKIKPVINRSSSKQEISKSGTKVSHGKSWKIIYI